MIGQAGAAADGKTGAVTAPPQPTHHLSVAAAGVAGAHHHAKSEHAAAGTPVSDACKAYLNELMLTGDVMIGSKMTVSYLSRRHPFRSVAPDASLLDVAKILAGESHRVPVVDAASGKLINIISQSSIIAFLNQHMKELSAEGTKTVDQWALGTSPVQSVRDNVRTIDVFRAMSNHHMSGLAVVDASGSFLANTNSTDLKLYLNHPKLGAQLLQEPILDFLSQLRQDDLKTDTRTKVPTLSVSSTAPLSLVIGRLAATKQHKIFVADHQKQYHPSAVISLTDVLVCCCPRACRWLVPKLIAFVCVNVLQRAVLKLKKPGSGAAADPQPAHGKLGANKTNH